MFLGLDIGTSAVKAVLIDQDGILRSEASKPLPIYRPKPLWAEQDPEDWWNAVVQATAALDPKLKREVSAIGLTGQMHGAVLLDARRRVLRPAILWNDGRSAEACRILEARAPKSRDITGNAAMPGFTAPKILWTQAHEPEIASAIDLVLLPKDYIRLRLTGDAASDMSDAAGTLWLDVRARAWSEEMLAATGLALRNMPTVHEGPHITGQLTAEAAALLGLPRAPVVAGAGDNAAGAAGAGVTANGQAMLSLGTSGVIFAATDEHLPDAGRGVHAFCHCLPGMWHQMSVMLSAAACLEWAAQFFGSADAASFAGMAEGVETDVLFLPYLSGERTPHNDPQAMGVFFGLTAATDRTHAARAVLEGVAMGLADGFTALRAAGSDPAEISVIGGGARNLVWGQILASALNVPLVYRNGAATGPAAGAARLAHLAMGGEPRHVLRPPEILHRIAPGAPMTKKHARFRALYRALSPEFRR